jgi:hypothetical protein
LCLSAIAGFSEVVEMDDSRRGIGHDQLCYSLLRNDGRGGETVPEARNGA